VVVRVKTLRKLITNKKIKNTQADEVVARVKALRKQSRELEEEIALIQTAALAAAGVLKKKLALIQTAALAAAGVYVYECVCRCVCVCVCVGVCVCV